MLDSSISGRRHCSAGSGQIFCKPEAVSAGSSARAVFQLCTRDRFRSLLCPEKPIHDGRWVAAGFLHGPEICIVELRRFVCFLCFVNRHDLTWTVAVGSAGVFDSESQRRSSTSVEDSNRMPDAADADHSAPPAKRARTDADAHVDGKDEAKTSTNSTTLAALLTSKGLSEETHFPLAVCGAHMKDLALNWQLEDNDGIFLTKATTAPGVYKMIAFMDHGPVKKPGLVRVSPSSPDAEPEPGFGVEIWALPIAKAGVFLAKFVRDPLSIGRVEVGRLADGSSVSGDMPHGFVCAGVWEDVVRSSGGDVRDVRAADKVCAGWRDFLDNQLV